MLNADLPIVPIGHLTIDNVLSNKDFTSLYCDASEIPVTIKTLMTPVAPDGSLAQGAGFLIEDEDGERFLVTGGEETYHQDDLVYWTWRGFRSGVAHEVVVYND